MRKGRENYLCLLNLEEAVNNAASGFLQNQLLPLGLIARWAAVTEDGDIHGGDLPGWLSELHGAAFIATLGDRRGECIHGACTHYRRCFVEHTIRRARTAKLVVGNHALVMAQAAHGAGWMITRCRHGTCSTKAITSSMPLTARSPPRCPAWRPANSVAGCWVPRAGGRGPAGLRPPGRGDLVADRPRPENPSGRDPAGRSLCSTRHSGWTARLTEEGPELEGVEPRQTNPTELFLRLVRQQVMARTSAEDAPSGRGNAAIPMAPSNVTSTR